MWDLNLKSVLDEKVQLIEISLCNYAIHKIFKKAWWSTEAQWFLSYPRQHFSWSSWRTKTLRDQPKQQKNGRCQVDVPSTGAPPAVPGAWGRGSGLQGVVPSPPPAVQNGLGRPRPLELPVEARTLPQDRRGDVCRGKEIRNDQVGKRRCERSDIFRIALNNCPHVDRKARFRFV